MREFGENVHKIWPQLGRKVKRDVAENNELYSFIPLNYTTVVPTGHDGRFREMYYWDSYWHIRGLLVSEAYQVVFELLNNFKSLVERFGFIPNGTRKYYTTRSQPPFYSTAVHDFYEHCKANPEATNVINMTCEKILEYFLPSMEAELKWWLQNRKIELENGDFGFAYGCPITVPRKGQSSFFLFEYRSLCTHVNQAVKVTNLLSIQISVDMAERSEAKSAKRSFASKN